MNCTATSSSQSVREACRRSGICGPHTSSPPWFAVDRTRSISTLAQRAGLTFMWTRANKAGNRKQEPMLVHAENFGVLDRAVGALQDGAPLDLGRGSALRADCQIHGACHFPGSRRTPGGRGLGERRRMRSVGRARVVWVLTVIVGSLLTFRCTSASHRELSLAPA